MQKDQRKYHLKFILLLLLFLLLCNYLYSFFRGWNKTLETYKAHVPPSLDINHTKELPPLIVYPMFISSFEYHSQRRRDVFAGIAAGIAAAAISFSVGEALRRRWSLR
jgi:hypothetical protein